MENQFAKQLNEWYLADHRDLPFRRFKDPYAIWISEVMAQQTRIESMLPYYETYTLPSNLTIVIVTVLFQRLMLLLKMCCMCGRGWVITIVPANFMRERK